MKTPKDIYIEPTNICNLQCSFCFHANNAMRRKKGTMTFKTFKRLVDDVKSFKPNLVLHHSGESFVHKELFDFIRYAKKAGLRVSLTTNGTLVDKNDFEILDTGIDGINISLAGVDKEDYANVRPGTEFDTLMENITALAKNKLKRNLATKLTINVVETKFNRPKIPLFKKRIESINGIDGVIVRRLMDWGGTLDISKLHITPFWRSWAMYANKYFKLATKGTLCEAINDGGAILWNGTVVPCCIDFNGTMTLGNINEQKFLDIWNGEKSNQIRKMLRSVENTKKHPTCGPCRFPTGGKND